MPGCITIRTSPDTDLPTDSEPVKCYRVIEVSEGENSVQQLREEKDKACSPSLSLALLRKLVLKCLPEFSLVGDTLTSAVQKLGEVSSAFKAPFAP